MFFKNRNTLKTWISRGLEEFILSLLPGHWFTALVCKAVTRMPSTFLQCLTLRVVLRSISGSVYYIGQSISPKCMDTQDEMMGKDVPHHDLSFSFISCLPSSYNPPCLANTSSTSIHMVVWWVSSSPVALRFLQQMNSLCPLQRSFYQQGGNWAGAAKWLWKPAHSCLRWNVLSTMWGLFWWWWPGIHYPAIPCATPPRRWREWADGEFQLLLFNLPLFLQPVSQTSGGERGLLSGLEEERLIPATQYAGPFPAPLYTSPQEPYPCFSKPLFLLEKMELL